MAVKRTVIRGVVKNGLVVPQGATPLPEGAAVDIVISQSTISTEAQAEFEAWERASDEAWTMIDQWEREDQP